MHVLATAFGATSFLTKTAMFDFGAPVSNRSWGNRQGFAVDRAVAALKRNGAAAGLVNAGGDLRAFGSRSQLVHVRDPAHPTRVAGAVRLRAHALATSGIYFAPGKNRGRCMSPLLDGRTGRASRKLISVTVVAADCMTADALTKVVFVLHERAAPLLARNGAPSWIFHPLCDTSRQT